MADLFATVLRPIAEQRGLETWEQLAAYAAEEWVPSRIAFGQHKGRSIAEARTDAGLRRWPDGLAQSANARNARMGRWSLRSLEERVSGIASEIAGLAGEAERLEREIEELTGKQSPA